MTLKPIITIEGYDREFTNAVEVRQYLHNSVGFHDHVTLRVQVGNDPTQHVVYDDFAVTLLANHGDPNEFEPAAVEQLQLSIDATVANRERDMAAKHITVKGVGVDQWEQSFRINHDGVIGPVIFVGKSCLSMGQIILNVVETYLLVADRQKQKDIDAIVNVGLNPPMGVLTKAQILALLNAALHPDLAKAMVESEPELDGVSPDVVGDYLSTFADVVRKASG